MQQDRYIVSYMDSKGNWKDVSAKTKQDGITLYEMVDSNCKFKVLYDSISGVQLMQS